MNDKRGTCAQCVKKVDTKQEVSLGVVISFFCGHWEMTRLARYLGFSTNDDNAPCASTQGTGCSKNECSFIVASSLGMNEHARWCISFGCARTVSVRWGSAAAACPRWLRRCVACCSCQLLILLLKGLVLVSGVFCSGCCGSTPSIVCSYAGYVGACDWRVTPWPMQMRRLGMIGGAFLQNCMRAFLGTCLSIN